MGKHTTRHSGCSTFGTVQSFLSNRSCRHQQIKATGWLQTMCHLWTTPCGQILPVFNEPTWNGICMEFLIHHLTITITLVSSGQRNTLDTSLREQEVENEIKLANVNLLHSLQNRLSFSDFIITFFSVFLEFYNIDLKTKPHNLPHMCVSHSRCGTHCLKLNISFD